MDMGQQLETIRACMKSIRDQNLPYSPLRWDYTYGAGKPCEYVSNYLGYDSCEHAYEDLVLHKDTPPGAVGELHEEPEYGVGGHFVEEGYEFGRGRTIKSETIKSKIISLPIVLVAIAIGVLGLVLYGRGR